jgi:universal stress protein B
MISGDTILFALLIVTVVNVARYFTTLRSLIYIMREAHPLLYQQVDGPGFWVNYR